MLYYILKRLLATPPVVVAVALIIFVMLRLVPGDPAAVIAGDNATAEDIMRIRERLGLTEPILTQAHLWLSHLVQGDLGRSIFANLPVTTLIGQRVWPTLLLATTSLLLTVTIAVPLGVLAAWRSGKLLDRLVMIFSVTGFSVPSFVIGYSLMYVFAVYLKWLPSQGYLDPFTQGWLPFAQHIALPTMTLSFLLIALIARMTRSCVLEVLTEDYIRTARAKGQNEFRVLIRHALPAAAVPIVTTIGLTFAILVGGVVVVESVFNIPGLGRLVLDAVSARDYPLIQGLILFFSFLYIGINLLIDLSYPFFDPRIRL